MIFIVMTLTLISGTLLSFESQEMVLFYAVYYSVCMFALYSFNYGKNFFLSFEKNADVAHEAKVILAGEEIAPKIEEDRQEDRFLNIFAMDKIVKRKFLGWFLFLAGIWLFYFKLRIEISFATLLPLLSCFLIINSYYVGHLLIALLLNALIVLFHFSPEKSLVLYALYGVLFLATTTFIAKKQVLKKKPLLIVGVIGLIYVGLSFGFSSLMPENLKFEEKKTELKPEEIEPMDKMLDKVTNNLRTMQSALPPEKLTNSFKEVGQIKNQLRQEGLTAPEIAGLKNRMNELMQEQNDLGGQFNDALEEQGRASGLSKNDRDILDQLERVLPDELVVRDEKKKQIRDLAGRAGGAEGQQLKELMEKTSLSGADQAQLQQSLERLDPEIMKDMKLGEVTLTEEQRNTTRSLVNRSMFEDQKVETAKKLDQLLDKPTLNPQEQKELAGAIKELRKEPVVEKPQLAKITPLEQLEAIKPLDQAEDKSWIEKLKRMLPFLGAMLVVLVLYRLLTRKGIKKIEATDPEILEELQEEWDKLRKLRLSPRDEVIHYYNLFHESLQKIHYSDGEAPPSCIIRDDMRDFNPELEKSTFAITEIFAQCYYGDKNVTPDALKMFRKGLAKILKVYQLD